MGQKISLDWTARPAQTAAPPSGNWRAALTTLQPLLETLLLVGAAWLALLLLRPLVGAMAPSDHEALMASITTLFAPFVLRQRSEARVAPRRRVLRDLAGPYLLFAAIATLALGLGWQSETPRLWLLLWLTLGFAGIGALRSAMCRAPVVERIAVVGAGEATDRLVHYLQRSAPASVELVGVFDDRATRPPSSTMARSGSVADLLALGRQRRVDLVLIALPDHAETRILELLGQLKSLSVSVALSPCGIELAMPKLPVEYVAGRMPLTLIAERPIRRAGAIAKAAEDYLLGGLLVLLLSPLLALIALAVRLDSPGPILFRQPRHAWNNAEFDVFKFRTMRWNPQGAPQPLRQTERGDPRVTRVGRFLRRTSLDELPQLFNVLRGEMSLVGPRPHAVDMRTEERLGSEIVETYAHRHRVKPGLTGLAQVRGYRGATHTAEQLRRRIEADLEYVEHWSLWLDLQILARTAWIVIRGHNAY
ncbi:exopolysaccharide biosynthesis polyprenyl glycosylphosphotransferase [Solimonas soli]|uniref:exopolysaccharide biosynthesis polyprenyl glycosylphosphotransferase n=1 Tax=Solimonas soli TaxID=413479 RepID=UPI0004B649AA|nr:exopolysaccharide biosynthesis polyprenyl glycosylphosphotransferase [Solimonas soli]